MGSNAQGKTSLLEALSLLTSLKSFRSTRREELILHGEEEASLKAELDLPTASEVLLGLKKNTKRLEVDKKRIVSRGQYDFLGSSVSFVPDDLFLIKGGPEQRRQFLDELIVNLKPEASTVFQRFYKALKQRNRLLKAFKEGRGNGTDLELWTDQYAEAALPLYRLRREVLEQLRGRIQEIYSRLFKVTEEIEIAYDSGFEGVFPAKDSFLERIERLQEAEKAIGYTLIGPHRDDLLFYLNGHLARSYASQGQSRSVTIALKIAQLELAQAQRVSSLVLLLDDIVSELDDHRMEALVQYLSNYRGQMFVSTAEVHKVKTLHERFAGFKILELGELSEASQKPQKAALKAT